MNPRSLTAVATTAGFAMAALAGCGSDGVPSNAVARVGDSTIKKATFDHWMVIAGKAAQQPIALNPPDFAECVAAKRKTAPKPAKGQPSPTESQLRTQCKATYDGIRDQVLDFLVKSEWYLGEADDLKLKITDKEIQDEFAIERKQQFPKAADFQKFIRTTGLTMGDLFLRVRIGLAQRKLQEHATRGEAKPTAAEIAAYYKKNAARFAQPERRDLRVVLTKTRARAAAAHAALAGGSKWEAVVKRYSIDPTSKSQGGALLAVDEQSQEPAFGKAVFASKVGRLGGPVKTQFGYYVFEVTKITKASKQTLDQSRAAITQVIQGERQQKSLTAYAGRFEKHWKSLTHCRGGYVVPACANAPKPKATTGVPTQPAG